MIRLGGINAQEAFLVADFYMVEFEVIRPVPVQLKRFKRHVFCTGVTEFNKRMASMPYDNNIIKESITVYAMISAGKPARVNDVVNILNYIVNGSVGETNMTAYVVLDGPDKFFSNDMTDKYTIKAKDIACL